MSQTVIINAERKLFYCWGWDRWKALFHLGGAVGCFKRGCRYMYVPELPHLRKVQGLGIRG